ncbi:MAG: hypothetical protein SA339_10090 [Methanomassiliicoccus sp.]|nr:hypothetical protein [Methanomassiliicoccus sp.]
MKKITSAAAVLVVMLLLAGMLLVPVGTVSASTSCLKVGDQWAMGKEIDLGSMITENKSSINDLLKSQANLTIDKLNVDSKANYCALIEVTGENETAYTIFAKTAVHITTSATVVVSGNVPVAGSYSASDNPFAPSSTVNKEAKTMCACFEENLCMVLSANITLEKSSMAISKMDVAGRFAGCMELDAKNVPIINTTDGNVAICYKDFDIGGNIAMGVRMNIVFNPALDLLQPPVEKGETWYTNASTATVTGCVNGRICTHGLTEDQKTEMISMGLKAVTGMDDLPFDPSMVFDHCFPAGGVGFGPYEFTIPSMKMHCLDESIVRNVNCQDKEYLIIQVNDGAKLLYSPDLGFWAGAYLMVDNDMICHWLEGTDYFTAFQNKNVDLEPEDTGVAASDIASINDNTTRLTDDVNGAGYNITDFFLKAPYAGMFYAIAIMAAVSVAVVAFVMIRPRKE